MKPFRFFATLVCLVLFSSLTSFTPPSNNGIVQDVLFQTNKFRSSKGLPELSMRKELNAIAQKHSEDMARGRVGFGHGGFDKRNAAAKGKIKSMRSFAENVAYGASNGKQAVTMWKNSRGHRKNMLGKFKYIGIGISKDRRGRIFYTQVFAG